ncbi:MAG: 1-deoxy-D-xylulose-5-phosphate synthase [Spirochaetes bacterium]|uniref:1-deoxy-D-xylulose-5-phosphate synthase n=1 Tax=Candidatus Aphodenecus pullistercoris TaxID=2840669 RepID=A0A9D9E8Y9_9SPIR|nr:1-deoxy-D-xylulose-5-phosphate synthase [Candidatus Aphodenecus pullistercoris]
MKDAHVYSHYRQALIGSIVDLAADHKDIVFLDADVSSCITSDTFQKAYPERFFNCGIAEANMAGMAAGMASAGLTPFIHSFACFSSRRDYDQLFISVGYTGQVVHVIGSDPGIVAQYNGGTHMPFEDIALFRQIPSFNIIEPSDAQSLYALIPQLYEAHKPSYIRTPRKGISFRYTPEDRIELGKAITLREGGDVAIIATGVLMVDTALAAAEQLAAKGIDATVVDLHTIRPLDTQTVEAVAKRTGHVIVCENGRYAGGTGEMIARHLAMTNPVRMDFMCVGDRYGEVGNLDYLKKSFGFTPEELVDKALRLLKK